MNRRILPLLAVLLAVGAAGCAPDRMSLEPFAVCVMPDTCSFSDKCDAYQLGAFSYESSFSPDVWFQAPVEVRNQAPNNADLTVGRVNSNDAHVTGYRLEISGPASTDITLDVGHQAVPAEGSAVVWTYAFPPSASLALPSGVYVVDVVYIGYYDNGREFETPGFPIAISVDDTTVTGFGCTGTDVVVCGSPAQSLRACGTP